MPQVHEFGEGLIPICVGKLHVGGRDLIYGEHAPEVLAWRRDLQQLHVSNGNLAFVTKSQAEALAVKVSSVKDTAQMKRLAAQAEKTHAAARALEEQYKRLLQDAKDLEARLKEVQNADRKAQAMLKGEPVTEAQIAEVAAAIPVEDSDKAPPLQETSVANLEAERAALEPEAKRVDVDNLPTMTKDVPVPELPVSISEPQAAQIEEYFRSLDNKALKSAAKEMGIKSFGVQSSVLVVKVIEAAKAKFLVELRQEAIDKAAQVGIDSVK